MASRKPANRPRQAGASRMPEGSVFYERVVPALLVVLGVVMLVLILVAAGVLLGLISFS